jgi:hypothetical protein
MAHGQLARLAVALQGSLDEEYTALLAAIEEVQSLMEAELQGRVGEPTQTELEAFVVAADEALRVTESDSLKATRNLPWTYTYFFGAGKDTDKNEAPALQCDTSPVQMTREEKDSLDQEKHEQGASPSSPTRKNSIQRSELLSVAELEMEHSTSGREQKFVPPPRAVPVRWADISDSDDVEPSPSNTASPTVVLDRRFDVPYLEETSNIAVKSEPPHVLGTQPGCHGCGVTSRQSFSRRNWKRLRVGTESGDGTTDNQTVFCLACTGNRSQESR